MPDRIDTALRQFSGYHMKRAFNVIQADLNATLKPLGLRMTSYSVLSVIASHAGVRQSQLADALSIERPNVVQLIDELEVAGWISRNRDPSDRRAWVLTCTLAGREKYRTATAAVQDHDARLTTGFSLAEREALIGLLQRIEANGHKGEDDVPVTIPKP
ncbi:MarR family winged helix-turn-helix transcriptional regulator [Flavimaricola marinus]|uniref:Transcriptional regulator SlyA n=1 Tax=Flavimaricola marinus TaxID=1819565 RepID=A0A238LBI9_9RHOB|nr:MarR family winged helix-turn-helix transcriptional regulator [Flavimaricola marinus]SMY06923.1 Transcriptional regulator SlyA [Flavimaricola marinus]